MRTVDALMQASQILHNTMTLVRYLVHKSNAVADVELAAFLFHFLSRYQHGQMN